MSRLTKWQELFHETGIINLNENHVRWAVKQFFKEYKIRLPKNIPWDLVMTKRKVFVNDFYSLQIIDEEFVKLPKLVLWLGNTKRIIATVYPTSIRDNKISRNISKMEIYINAKEELEIKSLENEPWTESELVKVFDNLRVKLCKIILQETGIQKVIIEACPEISTHKQIETAKIWFKDSNKPNFLHQIKWQPLHFRYFKEFLEPFVEHNFDVS